VNLLPRSAKNRERELKERTTAGVPHHHVCTVRIRTGFDKRFVVAGANYHSPLRVSRFSDAHCGSNLLPAARGVRMGSGL
jgi:hypothetical protein